MARAWREIHPRIGPGGVVVIYRDQVQGWVNELRNPEHWRPGCVAVSGDGRPHIAAGGDPQNGAQRWELIH